MHTSVLANRGASRFIITLQHNPLEISGLHSHGSPEASHQNLPEISVYLCGVGKVHGSMVVMRCASDLLLDYDSRLAAGHNPLIHR